MAYLAPVVLPATPGAMILGLVLMLFMVGLSIYAMVYDLRNRPYEITADPDSIPPQKITTLLDEADFTIPPKARYTIKRKIQEGNK